MKSNGLSVMSQRSGDPDRKRQGTLFVLIAGSQDLNTIFTLDISEVSQDTSVDKQYMSVHEVTGF